ARRVRVLMRRVSGAPPSLADVRPDLPAGLLAWVDSMLAKDPTARPAGAARAWDELDGVVCEALGARWRKDAALRDPAALTPAPVEAVERPATKEPGFVSA